MTDKEVGLGDPNGRCKVYIGNSPNYADISTLDHTRLLEKAEISNIGQQCGNGWRKVFNVYAKLLFALDFNLACSRYANWQNLRDERLLQMGSDCSLLFSSPQLGYTDAFHLVMGKHYAQSLDLPLLTWLDNEFAINIQHRLIVCPYFDYRQLSNIKIIRLVELIKQYEFYALAARVD